VRVVRPAPRGQDLLVRPALRRERRKDTPMKKHGRQVSALRRALQAVALVSLARRIGLRRGRRLAVLAVEGYLGEQRRRNGRR
jgi:hypothetical protein